MPSIIYQFQYYNKEDYFKNLALILHKNFELEKVCEINNIVKTMVLGDLDFPGIPSVTFGNGQHL